MSGIPGQRFQPGSAAAPSSQVEISVSCRNLRDKDAFSKSDPMCVLYTWDIKASMFHELGRTEMIKDTLNPDFVKKFVISYFFEESQKLKFEIFDVDSPSARLTAHDFLGRMECTLGEVVGCGSGRVEKKLLGIQGTAKIFVRTEEVSSSKENVYMQMRASGLDKKDFLGKSDPFLIFYRANGDGSYTIVHKTEVIKNTLNPTWKPFSLTARTLCNGDHDRSIKIECYDWDSDGSHDLIGEFTTNLKELVKAPTSNTVYTVINPKKKAKKRNYKNSGELMVMNCKVEIVPSFLDYLQGGVDMNFTVAIDFTASNGNPAQPSSLHYFDPNKQNQYASAIQAVGEIIQDYDTDKMFPVLGFGAKLPDGSVSHEFPCNFNPNNPYCAGIQGVMQAYYTSLKQVQLYGPTNFSPVINHVTRFASAKQDGSSYFVLLIITDGVITDMPNTISSIINASSLPMSIIIIGVGNAEFDAMDILDADGQRLGIQGRYAERDIVQFVPFREFMRGQFADNHGLSQAALAKAVLAEVPDQVVHYMKKKGIKPKPQRAMAPATSGTQSGGNQLQQQGQGPYPGAQHGGQAPNPGAQQGGQAPYPGAQQGGQAPNPGAQQGGQAPYPGAQQGGQAPYPGAQQGGQAPNPGAQQGGQAPYPGAQQGGQAPYPGAQQGGQAPYPGAQQGGQAPNPGAQQGGQAPYPGAQQGGKAPYPGAKQGGQAPYPGAQQGGKAPYPGAQLGGQAPYPGAQQGGQAPYPGAQQGGQAPYPAAQQGGQAPYPGAQQGGQTPYPGAQQGGQAPYPGAQQGGQAPYPAAQQGGKAPYPGAQQGGKAPYPAAQQGGGQAPYPGAQQGGQAPYPGAQQGGQAPYPGAQQGGGQAPSQSSQGSAPYPQGGTPYPGAAPGSAPYPTGPPGPPQRPPPTYQNTQI